jgi:O-antigen/teichoic acid export membrane protein
LAKLALIGIFIAIFMELIRSPLITLLYGPAFHDAIMLATPILLSIPLELLVSFLLTAIIAWGQSRTALIATVIAGTCNATLNLLLIPKFQALGAAYTTPISYGIFLLTLLVCLNRSISRPFSSHTERAFPSVYS